MRRSKLITYSGTSPASASTVASDPIGGLQEFDYLTIDATLTGATGGTLDVYLQRELGEPGSDIWADWYHFAQMAAGASATSYCISCNADSTLVTEIGIGTLSTPGVALAAGTLVTATPAGRVRVVYVAGASTSAGAAQLIYFTGWVAGYGT